MQTFSFSFDELPLIIENGFEAGLVAGSAEISYSRDGDWSVESISFDGHRTKSVAQQDADLDEALVAKKPLPSRYVCKPVALDRGTPIHSIVYDRLENEWSDKVQEAVNEQIEEDRQCAADDRADMRRDERMMERVR